jgi:hypothetical protein
LPGLECGSVALGRHSDAAGELLAEGHRGAEAGLIAESFDGEIGGFQQFLCPLDPQSWRGPRRRSSAMYPSSKATT